MGTRYIVSVADSNGCKAVDSVEIKIHSCDNTLLFIPDAFTPNNDGTNDLFYAKGNKIKEFHISIFNRWGELIFESNDMNKYWDGTKNGKPAQEGVFVYSIKAKSTLNEDIEKIGQVTLIR